MASQAFVPLSVEHKNHACVCSHVSPDAVSNKQPPGSQSIQALSTTHMLATILVCELLSSSLLLCIFYIMYKIKLSELHMHRK